MTGAAPSPATPPQPEAEAPFDPRDFRDALGSFTTGVAVITAANGGKLAGLTVNSFASVSLNPPLVLWSLRIHSPSMAVFQEASHFAVNVLAEGQVGLARHFARSSDDKFTGLEFREGLGQAPVLAGIAASFECRTQHRYYGGDHVIYLGAVESYHHTKMAPLVFSRGRFGAFLPDS